MLERQMAEMRSTLTIRPEETPQRLAHKGWKADESKHLTGGARTARALAEAHIRDLAKQAKPVERPCLCCNTYVT